MDYFGSLLYVSARERADAQLNLLVGGQTD